jgi:hypothetical protein
MKANRLLLMVGTAGCALRAWTQRLIANRGQRGAASRPKPARREIFVLTPEEKKTVCFVLIAFVLGLVTKFYRDRHPAPSPKPTTAGHSHGMRRPPPGSPR